MPNTPGIANRAGSGFGAQTLEEIYRQPELWPTTIEAARPLADHIRTHPAPGRVLLTGAGTSAYAGEAIAAAWPGAFSIPTTTLLVDLQPHLRDLGTVVSLARSGESPESLALVEQIREVRPDIRQFAILCNEGGALSRAGLNETVFLDPRTNDQSLVMTSSFSNLALAGILLARPEVVPLVRQASQSAAQLLPVIVDACQRIASRVVDRVVVLSSSPLVGWGREASLKVLEMCAGKFAVLAETFLGLRHGPMSFVTPDTVVVCMLSADPLRRAYELDLIEELRTKKIGYLVGIADLATFGDVFDDLIPAVVPGVDDALRTPFEILGPQLLGYHLSLRSNLNPDNPSPEGIINRVVQEFKIHRA